MTSEKETFYDAEIAPALLELAQRCQARGLTFLAVVEWAPGEQGRTYSQVPNASFSIRLTELAAKVQGNVDAFMFALMKYAREHGHGSLILAQLGVPAAGKVEGHA